MRKIDGGRSPADATNVRSVLPVALHFFELDFGVAPGPVADGVVADPDFEGLGPEIVLGFGLVESEKWYNGLLSIKSEVQNRHII